MYWKYKKAVLPQRWPRNAPRIWVHWKFSGLPDYGHGYISQIFHGLLFWFTLWMCIKIKVRIALPNPEIIGGTQKIWTVPGYARAPSSQKCLMGFSLDASYECTCQIRSP